MVNFGGFLPGGSLLDRLNNSKGAIDKVIEPLKGLDGSSESDPPEIIDDQEKAERERRFQKQCFLIENMEKFHSFNRRHVYSRFAAINGEPSVITNELTKRANIEKLFEVTPQQLSLLVPTLRIFKVQYKDENDKVGEDFELEFESHLSRASVNKITSDRGGRPNEVGIESFEWEYFGKNPAEATTNIRATLSIFFQNIEALGSEGTLDKDNSTQNKKASFTDLFVFSKRQIKEGEGCRTKLKYNPKNFRIKAIVGWALPPKNDLIDKDLRMLLGSMQTVLMLDLVQHKLNFNENGTLTLTAEYIGSVENSLNHPDSDILNIGENVKEREKKLAERLKCSKESEVDDPDLRGDQEEKDIEEEKDEVEGLKAKDRLVKYRRLLQSIKDTGRMFFVDIPKSSIGITDTDDQLSRKEQAKRREDPPDGKKGPDIKPQKAETDGTVVDKALEDGASEQAVEQTESQSDVASAFEDVSDILSEASERVDKNSVRINFVYFGDIINSVLEILEQPFNPTPGNTRVLMGPLVFYDNRGAASSNTQKRMINLADVPISLELFTSFWTNKVLKPGGINRYFLKQFIRHAVDELIFAAIKGGCTKANLKQQNKIGISVIPTRGTGPGGAQPRIEVGTRVTVDDIADNKIQPIPPGLERKTNRGIHHYIFIFSSSEPPDMFTGNREEDFKRGIYHLGIGEERGILKSISFEQIQQKYLKEANFERDGADVENFFRERYNASIELFGNVLFFPGSQLFVNPTVVGLGANGDSSKRNSLIRRLGIGGYYIVKDVKNTIDTSGFKTSIGCVHVNRGEGKEATPKELEGSESGLNGAITDGVKKLFGFDDNGGDKAVDSPLGGIKIPGFGL